MTSLPTRYSRRLGLSGLVASLALVGCASTPAPPQASAAAIAEPTLVVAATPAPAAPAAASPATPLELLPPLPRGRLDPADDAARADLWQRVRSGFVMPDLDNELVRKWEQWYASRPDYVARMTERGGRYLFHIVEEIERRGMPMDLALLPFIESAFNPQALSVARASGMWQFMPGTGKDFELRQNVFRDDRRDVLASTRAALDYLQRLHARFGDWRLALAAYNWGQGNVQRAINRNSAAGRGTDYESLRMPAETRNYVPKLQAVKNIVLRPEAFALNLAPLENHPFFMSVPIDQDIDVALIARLAGLTVDEFQQLNPQLNKPLILAAGTPQVLLPYDNANRFVRLLKAHAGPRASWTAWVAPRTLKPADAAKLVGMPEAELRDLNRIPARMLVKIGSTLLVPRSAHATADVSEHIADHATMALTPEARAQRHVTVRADRGGESVASVARRLGLKPEALARLNGVSVGSRFAGGQTIKVAAVNASAQPARRTAAARKPVRATVALARRPNVTR